MVGDAGEHIGEPGAGVDIIEPTCVNEGVKHRSALPAGIAAAEGPVPPSDSNAAHGAFGRIVRHADAAVIKEARKGCPSLQAVIHRLSDRIILGQFLAFLAQPFFERVQERLGSLTADDQTPLG